MTWGLHAWHWSNPRVSNSDLPPGSPTPLSPPSGLSLASSPRLLLVTVAVSQGLPPSFFFWPLPFILQLSAVTSSPARHNLKPSRVKTTQYCVRLGSGARWTAFVMVPGLQTYHLHGLLASMVTVLCGFVRRLVECVWLMACSDCAHCSSNAVIGLLTAYSSTRDQPAPNRRVIRASCSSKVIQWPS